MRATEFIVEGVAEGKITLSTDPNWYGATVDNYQATGPVVNIPAIQLVGFEPDDKMNQPKSKVNVEKILAGLKQGVKLPPLLVRKYKNGYQVLDGHHRFWAYKLLGVKSIPVQIVPDSDIEEISKQGVAEGKVINTYLWHGSRQKIPMLEPRQSVDTGGAAGSNQNAIYATSDPKVAIAMGLTTPGSDTGMFPNDPQMVLFSGKIRKGEYVYLHKLPFNGPDGKPQFVQGGNSREFHSIPGVEGIKPIEIKEIPVNKYLNLIRKATPADLKLRKKYMKKQGVAEGIDDPANLSRLQSVQSGRTALGLVNLPVVPSNDNPNTTAKVVNTGSRIVAVYKVRGVNIPFYISTGGGGKASVPTGKWYPVFGIHSSGWLNKGTEESINKFYGSKELARGAEILNKYLGDLRSVEDKIPLMKPDGYSIINKNLKPMSWHEVDSNVNEFKKRINAVLVQIGDAPHYPEVEYSKNDKKSQIVHLQNLAKFYPNITMKDFVNQGKEKIINDAMLEVNQLKNYYGQHKQADFVQLLSNLENDINSFKRGSPANNNNQNSVPTLGLLLKGTLGKINFATP